MELSGLQIFKYLPAAKKTEFTNCKSCGCHTCMAFALKAAKGQVEINACKYAPQELKEKFAQSVKQPQKTVKIKELNIGGENVLFRHEKTFINKPLIAIVIDMKNPDWQEKFHRVNDFEITRVSETLKIDLIVFRNHTQALLEKALVEAKTNVITHEELQILPLTEIKNQNFQETVKTLTNTRFKAVLDKDENFSNPVYVYFSHNCDLSSLCAQASFYICKYANMLLFEDFDDALCATLMTLRQNIFTDPQKPLQVEAKVYEFNNPDENSIIFMTTNFALTFFAVANELENLNRPSYLVVTPAEGMSVLTAWSAEKFTAGMVAKTLKKFDLANKVKTRKIIIPGLLAHMKDEFEDEIKDFEMVVGTVEAFAIGDFVKAMEK